MVLRQRFPNVRSVIAGLFGLASGLFLLAASSAAYATDLPPGVLNYLRQKDPAVKVRFDGLVLFSNGESYVPVFQQDPSLNPDAQQVISALPEKAPYPDLIQFDNHFYLLRLIQTSSGRLTLPKMAEYPLSLKEGLLPQDFVLPDNLYIPVELKVILGALPYNPHYTPSDHPSLLPTAVALRNITPADQVKPVARQAYIFNLDEQKIWSVDSVTGHKQGEVAMNCIPAGMQLSSDGKALFVPCLSTNELVVVDTGSNLVKTRILVGNRPDSVLLLPSLQEVWVSNRYSPFLSAVHTEKLVEAEKIALPGNGGVMAAMRDGKSWQVLVADAFEPKIYRLDLETRRVIDTWTALPEISAIRVVEDVQGQPEIWVASRTRSQVMVLRNDGTLVQTLKVAQKPVDMAAYNGKMFVLSAGESRLQAIDMRNPDERRTAPESSTTTISLGTQGFPSAMAAIPSEKRAYITMANSNILVVVNLETGKVENNIPVSFRASMIAMPPDVPSAKPDGNAEPVRASAPGSSSAAPPSDAQGNASSDPKLSKTPASDAASIDRDPSPAVQQDPPSRNGQGNKAGVRLHLPLGRKGKTDDSISGGKEDSSAGNNASVKALPATVGARKEVKPFTAAPEELKGELKTGDAPTERTPSGKARSSKKVTSVYSQKKQPSSSIRQ